MEVDFELVIARRTECRVLRTENVTHGSECVKKMTHPSTKLRANGNYVDYIGNFPFVLRLSKHERIFSHTLSARSRSAVGKRVPENYVRVTTLRR